MSAIQTGNAHRPALDELVPSIGQEIEPDRGFIAALPDGHTFVKAVSYGASLRTQTAKIVTTQPDGSEGHFFLRLAAGTSGREMFRGEFEGMILINSIVPSFAPKPIAWGKCCTLPSTYFFLSDYIPMAEGVVPEPDEFCAQLAELHRNSASPNGKFGFHVTTFNGSVPQTIGWEESWEVFFSKALRHVLELDLAANGPQPELVEAIEPIFERVIPRLLGRLQGGGRPIKPSLVHGNLWCGNSSINSKTGKPVIFDSSAFYAHNEYELGNWRRARSCFTAAYLPRYLEYFPAAEPVEEFTDRNILYSLRFEFYHCILFPSPMFVEQKNDMIRAMHYLAQKYKK